MFRVMTELLMNRFLSHSYVFALICSWLALDEQHVKERSAMLGSARVRAGSEVLLLVPHLLQDVKTTDSIPEAPGCRDGRNTFAGTKSAGGGVFKHEKLDVRPF